MTWTGTVNGSVERVYDDGLRLDSLEVNGGDPVSFAYDDDSLLASAGDLTVVREPDTGTLDTNPASNPSASQAAYTTLKPVWYGSEPGITIPKLAGGRPWTRLGLVVG